MSRIEKKQKQEIGELEPGLISRAPVIENEKEQKKKKDRKVGVGYFLFLVILLLMAGWIIWGLSASGLITVPVFSSSVYKIPTPVRVVGPGPDAVALTSDFFNSIITEKLQAGHGELSDRSVFLTLSEDSITASLRSGLLSSGLSFFDAALAQVAIDESRGIEIFLPLAGQKNGNALSFWLHPAATEGELVITSIETKIGNLKLPDWFSEVVLEPVLSQGLTMINQKIAQYSTVDEIVCRLGKVELLGTLIVKIISVK